MFLSIFFQLSVVPLFLAEVPGLGTSHLLSGQLVLQIMAPLFPVLDARVLDDLPVISLGHIERHFQVSNELSLLSLESRLRSHDRPPAVLLQTLPLLQQIFYLPSNVVMRFARLNFLAFLFPYDSCSSK